MKFEPTFAPFNAKNGHNIIQNEHFSCPSESIILKRYRLSQLIGCSFDYVCRFLAERVAIAVFHKLKFRTMPRTYEIGAGKNNSNAQTASTRRNRVSYKKFLIEKNAKNEAYSFILSQGMLDKFKKFINTHHSHDPHKDCVNNLLSKL